MAGLLSQGAPQRPQQAPQQPPQGQPAPQQQGQPQPQQQPSQSDPQTDADPQQGQQQYDALVQAMLEYLYGPGMQQVEQALGKGDDIVQRMSTVVSTVMLTIYHALAAEGKTVPPGVMFQAGMELSKAVGEMAMEMGRLPKQGNGEAVEAAFMAGIGRFGQLVQDSAMTEQQRKRYGELIRATRELKQRAGSRQQQGDQQPQQPAPQQAPQQAQQPAPAQKPMRGM
ncbi:hypothetical protein [Halomonas sp. IOP_31]|uniref:hypothetical protein n=1 Tax=Halomonas sp. IOP_31 TaxID=2876584 RepID=UPI001E32C089|nr:hypothetical protein [Halomonas sp. IOP_31]MCD6006917.1 hypothetical protein [Halomonas sp. IOP_31]